MDIVLWYPVTLLSSTDFELTVVPSGGITVFGAVDGDIFSDEGFTSHYLLSPAVTLEMELRFGDFAKVFMEDYAHLAATHCLRVRRVTGVHLDDHGRAPHEVLRAVIYGFGGTPSKEALAALERIEESPGARFYTAKFPQRIRDDYEGTDRLMFRKLILLHTDTGNGPDATTADGGK